MYDDEFEDKSKLFMANPQLYRIGIERQCYTMPQYVAWIFYGLLQALYIYFLCFYFIELPGQLTIGEGKGIGLWVVGHITYGACCLVANILILYRFNNFTGWGELLVALMCLCFFTAFWFENNFTMFKEVYGIFYETFSSPAIWLTLFLTCGIIAAIEYGKKAWKALKLSQNDDKSNKNKY